MTREVGERDSEFEAAEKRTINAASHTRRAFTAAMISHAAKLTFFVRSSLRLVTDIESHTATAEIRMQNSPAARFLFVVNPRTRHPCFRSLSVTSSTSPGRTASLAPPARHGASRVRPRAHVGRRCVPRDSTAWPCRSMSVRSRLEGHQDLAAVNNAALNMDEQAPCECGLSRGPEHLAG